ncbi:MAG: hypothetical protein ABI675_28465 [Chitinophagaceae bacterium]
MKKSYFSVLLIFIVLAGWNVFQDNWLSEKHKCYTMFYKKPDEINQKEYSEFMDKGIKAVQFFFSDKFKHKFDVHVHPNRQSLDSQWQKDWKMPEFKSECWMVASGVGDKLDIISPKSWDKESCEHSYADKLKTQQLITHELFHVYHGQYNASSDFSNAEKIDWFVEGLATFASGQCDSLKIAEVKKAIRDNKFPKSLNDFWKGKLRYGMSGSMAMFIDSKYGRTKLKNLLPFDTKPAILNALGTTEEVLLTEWKNFLEK